MQVNHQSIFPTIVSDLKLPAFSSIKDSLIQWIYNYKENTEGVAKSNRGGWQSPDDFWTEESFKEFYDYMSVGFSMWNSAYSGYSYSISNMWINVNKPGDYNTLHVHPLSKMSGCFYIKVPENSGSIIFECPSYYVNFNLHKSINSELADQFNFYSSWCMNPYEGTMLFFPPHLQHEVATNRSNEDRITIAFNLD